MEPRSQMAMIVLLLSLVLMSTVVTGRTVESRPAVTIPTAENNTREQGVHQQASNSTSCEDENADTLDLLNQFLPCVPAVSIITSTPPTTDCCDHLESNGLTCLCSLFVRYRDRIPLGVVSMQKVTELPRQCGIPIPEGAVCDGISVPSNVQSNQGLDFDDKLEPISFDWLTINP